MATSAARNHHQPDEPAAANQCGGCATRTTGPVDAWRACAPELARWAWARSVNRCDAWGGYLRPEARFDPDGTTRRDISFTAPALRERGKRYLSPSTLERHFGATHGGDVIGTHTTSPEGTSLWGLVDADYHGEGGADPGANLRAALSWFEQLRRHGFQPLLTESNGGGGYHLRALFAEVVPTPRVYALMRWLVRDYADHGLGAPPETFPKQAALKPGGYGNWCRLPGRHHTREHWSRVWDGSRWLEGAEAVACILALDGNSPGLIPPEAEAFGRPRALAPLAETKPVPPVPADALAGRVQAYMARLPHLGEGQGRDDVAYHFAAWLVRDLRLPDEQALAWLCQWDAANTPPKGEGRLKEIVANAHTYGRRGYGEGLQGRCGSYKRDHIKAGFSLGA